MFIDKIAPKKFLCRYPLRLGVLCVSGLMICISIICGGAILAQILMFDSCNGCPHYVWKNAYAFSITALVYSVLVLATHIWLIFGVIFNKSSIVLSWVVITSMWLTLTVCLLIVLIVMYSAEAKFIAWILSLVFGFIAIGILLYTILVVYGFWLKLKQQERQRDLLSMVKINPAAS